MFNTPSRIYDRVADASSEPTALILGANGRLGRTATEAFSNAGWKVLAQARRPFAQLPLNARYVDIDLSCTSELASVAASASVVIYAVNPVYTDWNAKLLTYAKQGMDVALRLGALFMLPGNVYSFGAQMPPRLLETTAPAPSTSKGVLRAALEDEMHARATRGLKSIVIRAGDFFGGAYGAGSWLDQVIVKSIRDGKLVYPGPPELMHAWTYLPDFAKAFVSLAELHADGALEAGGANSALANASLASGAGRFTTIHYVGHNLTGESLLAAVDRAAARLNIAPRKHLQTQPFAVGSHPPGWASQPNVARAGAHVLSVACAARTGKHRFLKGFAGAYPHALRSGYRIRVGRFGVRARAR
jgi:nucleoside-diphosphate-sugar epimerase